MDPERELYSVRDGNEDDEAAVSEVPYQQKMSSTWKSENEEDPDKCTQCFPPNLFERIHNETEADAAQDFFMQFDCDDDDHSWDDYSERKMTKFGNRSMPSAKKHPVSIPF
jgi:hypothetical protein